MLILPDVLRADALSQVRSFLSMAEFVDGKATAGQAIRERKENEQLKRVAGQAAPVDAIVSQALLRHPLFQAWALPLRMIAPVFNRHREQMHYGNHVDQPVTGMNPPIRADISVSIFLSDPKDYEGGELVVESPAGPKTIKLSAGSAFAYLSNALHRVNKVTSGERLAAVTWVQSVVPDDRIRAILFDMSAVLQSLAEKNFAETQEFDLLSKAHQNLLRLHARP